MRNTARYTIFRTKWGYFGLAGTDNGLLRTFLPTASREKVKSQLLRYFPSAQYDSGLFESAQRQIAAYFEGARVNFSDIPVELNGMSTFTKRVLDACMGIEFGQTVSYGRLAELVGSPAAARAVGGALSKNPLPLIIPCHRVICSNGKVGGFSAAGGKNLKEKLLKHEEQALISNKSG
ncbi:MAG: methylated-DNA--[protein]-cysteine S-methyltransferase [Phycisphaerae bacterium]|nr:methylated-DNA--[protein]-cysteine S-methyltransferase [Phycisphaerae bacterium]